MYLKRLELCGFKSFADRTRLEFEPGISAIIGPNGCGKSNISDSIRWCLGEQSARSMRSTQMLDVIFGGSQSRQTTGMAEVSLTFDNSQNVLPIDYSEVTVTRRLFRSGESEYFINKAQCRLKDIRDLFLDTGIGAEGYSVIEQGKVEFLLTAKPEERRELFEEAAGVSKYKVRREETLRKLEKVDIDMNRVNDMLALLKEQISSLDAAARKARQYQKHKDDLKRLETASIVRQIISAKEAIARVTGQLSPRSNEFERLNAQLDQVEAELSQLRLRQVEKDEEYVRLQDEFSKIKSDINVSDERIRQAGQREGELSERKESLRQEIESDTARIRQAEAELIQVQSLWQQLSERVQTRENEYREKEECIQGVRRNIAERQGEENQVRSRLFALADEKASLHNERNGLLSAQAHCRARIDSLQKELVRLNEQRDPLQNDILAREKEVESFRAKIDQLTADFDNVVKEVTDIEEKRKESQGRQIELKEKLVSIESKQQTLKELAAKDPALNAVRSVLSLNLPGIRGPLSSFIQIDPGMENIVAASLGDTLNYVLCDTLAAAQQAVKHLEENNLGRVTFLVQERLPENPPVPSEAPLPSAMPLLSMIRCDQAVERALRYLCGETHVDGRSIYGRAVLQGGGDIVIDRPVFIDEHLENLAQEYDTTQQELSAAIDQCTTIQEQLRRNIEQKRTIEMERQKASVQIEWLEKQTALHREETKYLDKEFSLNQSDIQAREQEDRHTVEKLTCLDTVLADTEKEERHLKERQHHLDREMHSLREEENRLLPLFTEAKVSWATETSELAGREREIQRLKESLSSLSQSLEHAQEEIASIGTKLAEQKQLQEAESAKLRELVKAQERMNLQVQAKLSERQELMRELEAKNMTLHSLRQELETLKQEIHDIQLEQRSFELQRQNLEHRLQEEYAHTFAEVSGEFSGVEVSEEEIARLKRRIEAMGAVNLAAPEEYANLEQRYNFLLSQQQDLLKAKEDLHQVITKINQNTRENFKRTFDLVRENFRGIYRQLFEGGEADLLLTDESNLLECGIDIMAQPPGKKLQNITLLSGGEKALTAIALLFAFFMVKPSPFCILDEVDAPLDDANIGRYISMIKNFSAHSQFLVITHNKRTMEMADILYGVTMEELGVSKIISVRLNKEDLAATA